MPPPQPFDDDFAEASMEAISFAALRAPTPPSPPQPTSNPADSPEATFPSLDLLKLHPYPFSWSHDLLNLPYNAIRAELADMVALLTPLQSAPNQLPILNKFSAWHPVFAKFLSDFLTFENQVLHPWLFRPTSPPIRPKLDAHSAYISDLLAELGTVLSLFKSKPSAEVAPALLRLAAQLANTTAGYVDMQAKALLQYVEARTKAEALNVTRVLMKSVDPVLLTRWIEGRKGRVLTRGWRWGGGEARAHLKVVGER